MTLRNLPNVKDPTLAQDAATKNYVDVTGTPTIAKVNAGAGANAVVTISGTNKAGYIQLVQSALDTPSGSSDILTVTFSPAYPAAPKVIIMPSNDVAWALALGIVRLRDADTTTALFKLRSGTTGLPALTGATYRWTYHVLR